MGDNVESLSKNTTEHRHTNILFCFTRTVQIERSAIAYAWESWIQLSGGSKGKIYFATNKPSKARHNI